MATLVVTWMAVSIAAVGGTVAADSHTYDEAPDYTDTANFTINFPFTTDHYPGEQNPNNGSIQYFSSGEKAFTDNGAEEGVWMDTVIVNADWIDYSECETENTAVYGIDRGNNNKGTQVDEDLIEHTIESHFRDDGITVKFYSWEDFGGDPPYLAPEDAQVSEQGARSNGGACLHVTDEPGWYNIQGFLNGTIANGDCTEEGNADCEPENKEQIGVYVESTYEYVCVCDSEEEAREKLGPPPGEDGTETPTATPTPTPSDSDDSTDATATPTATDEPEETPTATDEPEDTATPEQTTAGGGDTGDDDDGGAGDDDASGNATPTPGGGPGFTAITALLALLATALLANRRL